MHGFGLSFILEKAFRKTASKLAVSRPLRGFIEPDIDTKPDIWQDLECLDNRDWFLLSLFKKYKATLFDD